MVAKVDVCWECGNMRDPEEQAIQAPSCATWRGRGLAQRGMKSTGILVSHLKSSSVVVKKH